MGAVGVEVIDLETDAGATVGVEEATEGMVAEAVVGTGLGLATGAGTGVEAEIGEGAGFICNGVVCGFGATCGY